MLFWCPATSVAPVFGCLSITGSAFTFASSSSAVGGGRPIEMSADAVRLTALSCEEISAAASSVDAEKSGVASSSLGYLQLAVLAGISSACGDDGTRFKSSSVRSKGRVRFAALRRAATVRFSFEFVGMEVSA
jgi:hypothetical protein